MILAHKWNFCETFDYGQETSTEEDPERIEEFRLFQYYPNPFNPSTTISFSLPEISNVHLTIIDMTSRQVVNLIEGKPKHQEFIRYRLMRHIRQQELIRYRLMLYIWHQDRIFIGSRPALFRRPGNDY